MKDARSFAADERVTLVAAAGNSGPCTECVGYPTAHSEVIAVSATTSSDTLADRSSTGPERDRRPRQEVLSTVSSGTIEFSGTPVPSPHVAGAGLLDVAAALGDDDSDD